MTRFSVHNPETAPDASRPLLRQVERQFGSIPNVYGIMAESPALLKAYLEISTAFANSSLTPQEQQVVIMTASYENGSHYCLAAHSTEADMSRLPLSITEAIRDGRPIEIEKLQALRKFTAEIVTQQGWVDQQMMNDFLAAGYSKMAMQDVLTGIGKTILSNYNNHIAKTPLDETFRDRQWHTEPLPLVGCS